MKKNEIIGIPKKMDRRNFFLKAGKTIFLATLTLTKSNHLFSKISFYPISETPKNVRTRLMIPSVWWRELSQTNDGKLSYWDTEKLRSLKANWVSVSYRPLNEKNEYVGTSWVIPPKMIKRVMQLALPGLQSAHQSGIQVVGTTDSMQFNPEVMKSAGIDPELLYGYSLAGKKIGFDAYQKGNYLSCLMNPNWQEIEAMIGQAHAEAGFDGLFLDLFPYIVREGVLCGCDHCKKGWESYSERIFGKKQNFPKESLLLNRTVDRVFMTWRLEAIYRFMQKIQEAGKKYNPDFKVILNCNADNPCMAYLLLMGMPQPTSELGQLEAGNNSSLYLYRMIESANETLFAQFNGPRQYLPEYKYKTALAEAYAGGGALMLAAKNQAMDEINKHFTDFLFKNRDSFEESISDAKVGILFSWRDHAFLQSAAIVRTDRMIWNRNSARRSAAILASKGIAYDYIFVEKGFTTNDLLRYKVIIAPELKILDDKDAASIFNFVSNGGRLLVLGLFGTLKSEGIEYVKRDNQEPIKQWLSKEIQNGYLESLLGDGKICVAESYLEGNNEADMSTTSVFNKAASFVELDSQIKVLNHGKGRLSSTIRKKELFRFIHLIRYGCSGENGETKIKMMYLIPEDYQIKTVISVSPFTGNESETIHWKVDGGYAIIETMVDLYSMIRVELAKK